MSNHTPGQWLFSPSSGAIYAEQGAGTETIIAGINQDHPSPEQSDADGRLMAAAPDMLAALRECVAVYEAHRDEQPTGHLWPDPNHIYHARNAIAKAAS